MGISNKIDNKKNRNYGNELPILSSTKLSKLQTFYSSNFKFHEFNAFMQQRAFALKYPGRYFTCIYIKPKIKTNYKMTPFPNSKRKKRHPKF